MTDRQIKPTSPSREPSWFDRFASAANAVVSRAWFFSFCLLLVLLWAPSLPLFDSAEAWQLPINTMTTIVTFLLVALLQNTSTRADQAIQKKLNALAEGVADLLEEHDGTEQDVVELRAAVGLEHRESA
jgi:low affinity Fe/Cu permease